MIDVRLMQGNEACASGALAAGALFFAGYPITPSSEIAELMAERLPLAGGTFIQMEDEIASMAAVIGASLTGAKAFTATSGPGFSLKQENIGYAAATEVPCVVINVQRGGPSTGLPTSPSQSDVMQTRWGTHGDHPVIVLSPFSVQECFDLTVKAFNFAEQFRTPVILLLDEVIAHLRERVTVPESSQVTKRKGPGVSPGQYYPYANDASMIPPMADFGDGYRFHVTGLAHDINGSPTGVSSVVEQYLYRLNHKLDKYLEQIILCEEVELADTEIVVVAYGCTARSALEAVYLARQNGLKVGMLRLITIWPFPETTIRKWRGRKFLLPEMNCGQLAGELARVVGEENVHSITRIDGELITPDQILSKIMGVAKDVSGYSPVLSD